MYNNNRKIMGDSWEMWLLPCYRVCKALAVAGCIGMAAGTAGYVYIHSFSEKTPELLQTAEVFNEIDGLSFVVALGGIGFMAVALASMEVWHTIRHWKGGKKKETPAGR